MTLLRLKVEGVCGDMIGDVALAMRTLADRIGVIVECPFNDVELVMYPNGSVDGLVEDYRHAIKTDHIAAKIAFGRPL
jgi:hypothetical protein